MKRRARPAPTIAGPSWSAWRFEQSPLRAWCGGQVMAEAVTNGSPDGIMIRVTLTQPGMRHEVWEQPMPVEATIGKLVKRFWEDPMGTAIVPAGR